MSSKARRLFECFFIVKGLFGCVPGLEANLKEIQS